MPIRLGVPKEIEAGERRVALVPAIADRFAKLGVEVLVQRGAGTASHYPDEAYRNVTFVDDAAALYQQSDIVLKVQPPTGEEIDLMKEGAVLIGMMQPHRYPQRVARMRDRKLLAFAMELVPRISRAQSMDVLSSQAAVAGYKAALLAANHASGFFPMLTTAAGTIRPARVLIIGAGVAGLQAIATAKRLGAIVEAYDVRSATKEQCESLGAKFIDTGVHADGEGGYARELTEEEKAQQLEVLTKHVQQSDVVITTAAIPGKPSPKIITADMVDGMKIGAVIVDLASEGGGNCELTVPGETVDYQSRVTIHGPLNVPSQTPVHASEMYARNLFNLISPFITEDAELALDWEDEVLANTVLTHDGEVKSERYRREEISK